MLLIYIRKNLNYIEYNGHFFTMAQNPNALNRKKIINRNLKENKTK